MRKRKRRYKSLDKYEMLLYPERLEALKFNEYDQSIEKHGVDVKSSNNDELSHVQKAFVIALAKIRYHKSQNTFVLDVDTFTLFITAIKDYLSMKNNDRLSNDDIIAIAQQIIQSFVRLANWGGYSTQEQAYVFCTSFIHRYNQYDEIKEVFGQFFSLLLDQVADHCDWSTYTKGVGMFAGSPIKLGRIAADVLDNLYKQQGRRSSFKYNDIKYEVMVDILMIHIFIKVGGPHRRWSWMEMMMKFGFQLTDQNVTMLATDKY